MKNHKRNDPEHDYCNKCDVDCDSWDDFVEHKANANPKVHIACLHCGQDFKSIPGRNRHIAQVSNLFTMYSNFNFSRQRCDLERVLSRLYFLFTSCPPSDKQLN